MMKSLICFECAKELRIKQKWFRSECVALDEVCSHCGKNNSLREVEILGETKQVIVMRSDLGMRKGKMIAQGCHASLAFLTRRLVQSTSEDSIFSATLKRAEIEWLESSFAKICCRVDSEQELLEIHEKALAAGLVVHLITDSGRTEFHGQLTHTCLAIGPDYSDKINPITGHLRLL